MWMIDLIDRSIDRYRYIDTQNMFPKVGVLEETKERGKEKKNDRVNNNKTHHVGVGTNHNTMHRKLVNTTR
jgi:hypothetical protein